MDLSGLTICSVSFHSSSDLDLNIELTRKLNPEVHDLEWVIVDNTPESEQKTLNSSDQNIRVFPGVRPPEFRKYRGSYQHGAALNLCITHVKTQHILVLDPDFFIVRKSWINEVLDYMSRNNLAMLGVPWHPRWYRKYRYFPCSHCLFLDLSKLDRSDIDFTPDLINNPASFISPIWIEHERQYRQGSKLRAWSIILKHPWQAIREDIRQRRLIGTSRDTSYKIFKKFQHEVTAKYEVVNPVFKPHEVSFKPEGVSQFQRSKLVEFFLPDHLSYIPPKKNYFTPHGFKENGLFDLTSRGWEEFFWKGRPFGFHVRGSLEHAYSSSTERAGQIILALENLTGISL